ncbi:site-specific DNA-methyltransferase [Vibrio sp. YT-19(2023)]|uniref:site-specific DNA-methyltransferase n=1 Tax=Vibrio sp. YT-19(2023) TaxID=3074710 RepID=UPI002964085D|nr:site-specific DNA-methyltransferase [Vibrio sp. YT-19(2023)]MDW1500283.1 site-specific DNA-methyltransferase [Vibrio sp. YT-19(2023)]
MEQLKMHSPNMVDQNIEKLAELFPGCVTEAQGEDGKLRKAIDFDLLRQELSRNIVEGPQERYQLNWPGKREALLTANAPIAKTLRPCREESVDFDTTQNLFIEGDNLDALKLLQETYLGKVKVIYIDPPYNTGNDFIYDDNFVEDLDSYIGKSNQKDELGNRLVVNTESNGRFHSDWLSMIYPRLKLAWNLLADDGIIGVSISDSEVFQLGKVLDEVFGSESRLACAPWLSEASGGKEKTGLRTGHEYLLIYYKNSSESITSEERSTGELNSKDKFGPYRKGRELMKWGGTSLREDRPNQFYQLTTPNGDEVYPYRNDGKEGHWRWGKNNEGIVTALEDPNFFHWEQRPFDEGVMVDGKTHRWVPYEKIRDVKKSTGWSTWLDKYGTNADGTRELKELFGSKPFDTPKPTSLIKWFINLHSDEEGLVVDFFAGSAATAHAVMQSNVEEHANRKFILVQLPELCSEKSEGYKLGFKDISEISKERIRKVAEKISSTSDKELDNGFRVLKIDSSNMADVYYQPDTMTQADLFAQVDNVKEDRTEEDLLFQVMLDWGVDLALPIRRETVDGKTVFFVADNALVACFDKESGINEAFVKELAKFEPLRLVFRDAGFASDSTKINVEQVLKQLSPNTDVKSI